MDSARYPILVAYSDEDGEYVATTPAFPRLSALDPTAEGAVREFEVVLAAVLDDFAERGETPPAPKAAAPSAPAGAEAFSGKYPLRMPRSLHARLSQQAEAEGVSLNTLLVSRLSEKAG